MKIYFYFACLYFLSQSFLMAQLPKEGSYMTLFGVTHYQVSVKDNQVNIKPCQSFHSQLTIDNNTFDFTPIQGSSELGWKGSEQVKLEFDASTNVISFPTPTDLSRPTKMKLIHPNQTSPKESIKTYWDKTDGGFSPARYLVTDSNQIKNSECLIHSNPTSDFNNQIVGSYTGLYEAKLSATLNSDHTGTFSGLPMKWSIVSDHNGNVKKWDYPSGGFLIHLMIEFENELPMFVDPAPGETVAIISSLRFSADDNSVEFHQMSKN